MSPPQPIRNCHVSLPTKLPNLPDLVLTALSVCFLSSARPNKKTFLPLSSSCLRICPRREVKFAPMPLHNLETHHSHGFANPSSLSDWLRPRLPAESFASWGVKPGTKNVHNLWLEISEGETSLADSVPPVRTVNVVTVRVLSPDRTRLLIESLQELSDGTVRRRNRPLSEKMKPNEDAQSAAIRAVAEELGSAVNGGQVRILAGSYRKKVEERFSLSYPGLPARYELHSVEAVVEGLPDGEFYTTEDEEYGGERSAAVASTAVSVKKHFWRWVSADSVPN